MKTTPQANNARHEHYQTGICIAIGAGLGILVQAANGYLGGPAFLDHFDVFIGAGIGAVVAVALRMRQRAARA